MANNMVSPIQELTSKIEIIGGAQMQRNLMASGLVGTVEDTIDTCDPNGLIADLKFLIAAILLPQGSERKVCCLSVAHRRVDFQDSDHMHSVLQGCP